MFASDKISRPDKDSGKEKHFKGFILDEDIRKPTSELNESNAISLFHQVKILGNTDDSLVQYARDGKVQPLLEILKKFREFVINAPDNDGVSVVEDDDNHFQNPAHGTPFRWPLR